MKTPGTGRVIVVEGPDGTGKSTLARALCAADGSAYHHQAPYTADPFAESMRTLCRHPAPLVCDRFHVGEQVYGPIYRGGDAMGIAGRRMLERALLGRGAVLVLLLPPFAEAFKNWRRRKAEGGEMFTDTAGYRRVWHGFRTSRTDLPAIIYDYTAQSPARVAELVAEWSYTPNLGPGSGAWRPYRSTLIVADRPDPRARVGVSTWANPAFCSRAPEAVWLAEQLEDAGIPERDLYWIHAKTARGVDTPADFLDRLVPRRIVAIGATAMRWCRAHTAGAVEIATPHQHMRYHRTELYPIERAVRG